MGRNQEVGGVFVVCVECGSETERGDKDTESERKIRKREIRRSEVKVNGERHSQQGIAIARARLKWEMSESEEKRT